MVVLIAYVRERKLTPPASRTFTVSIKCGRRWVGPRLAMRCLSTPRVLEDSSDVHFPNAERIVRSLYAAFPVAEAPPPRKATPKNS